MLDRRLIPNAAFYAAYYSGLGMMIPFLPAYFARLGMSGQEIGLLLSFSPIMTSFTPPIWGYLADRFHLGASLLRAATAGALLMLILLSQAEHFPAVALAMLGYAASVAPILPLLDGATISVATRHGVTYANVRLFGSIGFVLSAFGLGSYARAFGAPDQVLLPMLIGVYLIALGVSFLVRLPPVERSRHLGPASPLLADRRLRWLLLGCGLHWLAMTPYNTFFSLYVESLGFDLFISGAALAAGALAEIAVMIRFARRNAPAPHARALPLCFLITALRWAMTAVIHDPRLLIAVQLLHAFSFGWFYLAALALLQEIVPERWRATGQALFVAAVFGIGGGLGALLAGAVYDRFGGSTLYLSAAGVSLLAAAVIMMPLRGSAASASAQDR